MEYIIFLCIMAYYMYWVVKLCSIFPYILRGCRENILKPALLYKKFIK